MVSAEGLDLAGSPSAETQATLKVREISPPGGINLQAFAKICVPLYGFFIILQNISGRMPEK
jgi:hypothetical protein